jgi:hypothetical protein
MATSANRVASNRANARHSTGPNSGMPSETTQGKARSSQNARKHSFNPDPFAVVRIEDRAAIASLVADAIATYQPINSRERSAVECIALAKHSMLRMYTLEAGFFTNCLDQAMAGPAEPFILNRSELATGIEISLEQHRAYWLAFGFNCFTRQSKIAATFLRFQAQAERLHRRAVDDFHRLLKLRGQLPPEKYEDPIEPKIEPIAATQPAENTVALIAGQPIPQPANDPALQPPPTPAHQAEPAGRPPAHHPSPMVVTKIVVPRIVVTQEVPQKRQAAKSRSSPVSVPGGTCFSGGTIPCGNVCQGEQAGGIPSKRLRINSLSCGFQRLVIRALARATLASHTD